MPLAQADCCAAHIKKAELSHQGTAYLLTADIDYQLSGTALEALQNGVPLVWDIKIKIQRDRTYLWPETLAETIIRYRLQYHALLNLYQVKNETDGKVDSLSTLAAAFNVMSSLRNLHSFDDARLATISANASTSAIWLALKVEFDRNALPLPLQPLAYLNPQWYLSSDWSSWPLKN